jgi:hypothetical protein
MNLGLIILFNYIIKKYKTRFIFNYIIKNNNISKWIEFFLKNNYDDMCKNKILLNKKNYRTEF